MGQLEGRLQDSSETAAGHIIMMDLRSAYILLKAKPSDSAARLRSNILQYLLELGSGSYGTEDLMQTQLAILLVENDTHLDLQACKSMLEGLQERITWTKRKRTISPGPQSRKARKTGVRISDISSGDRSLKHRDNEEENVLEKDTEASTMGSDSEGEDAEDDNDEDDEDDENQDDAQDTESQEDAADEDVDEVASAVSGWSDVDAVLQGLARELAREATRGWQERPHVAVFFAGNSVRYLRGKIDNLPSKEKGPKLIHPN